MSADENERLEAYKRKLAIWDYNVNIHEAKKEGIQQGLQEEKKKIAQNLKRKGIDIGTIAEVTGLSKEEIQNLS